MKVLITGANGFIGSFLTEGALERGYEVWAAVRKDSRRDYLTDGRIHIIELDYSSVDSLCSSLAVFKKQNRLFNVVIHAAGATKCVRKEHFFFSNVQSTINLVEALKHLNMLPDQFIYMSTLSVFGPAEEMRPFMPICSSDRKVPNTYYAKSKLQAERYIQSQPGLNWVIFRPTGVYGPRDRDYYLMTRSVRLHVDFSAGFSSQRITFLYVKDLVMAVYLAVEKKVLNRAYFVSDGNSYDSRTFSKLVAHEFGIHSLVHVRVPLWLLWSISLLLSGVSSLCGKSFTLNRDKYHILSQRNWLCDITPLEQELGFKAKYSLSEGIKETIVWYLDHHWL